MTAALRNTNTIRWGILGAGGIAATVGRDITLTEGNTVGAVAARDPRRAADLAAELGAGRSYGDYRALVEDPDIDVVYVATTHPQHHDQALMVIEAGKAVLVEKPVCLNAAATQQVFAAAQHAGVFAMEAMWMRTNPLIRKARQLVADGVVGEIRAVQAGFGLGLPFDPSHRLYDLANGGGALLDLGIYPVTFAWMFLGGPDSVAVTGSLSATGSDATVALQLAYQSGQAAQLWCSAPIGAPNTGLILGTEGWIRTEGRLHRPDALTISTAAGTTREDDPIAGAAGYVPEIAEVSRCLRAGQLESPLITHADTVAIMQLLDSARAELGVRYPGE